MHKYITIIVVLFSSILFAQKSKSKGMLSDDTMIIEYVIYFMEDLYHTAEEVRKVVNKKYSDFEILDTVPDIENIKGSQVIITQVDNVREEFPPVDVEYLNYTSQGLDIREKIQLQRSKHALVLDFACERKTLTPTIKRAHDLINKLIKDHKVAIYDSETRETFGKEYWVNKTTFANNAINISEHITIHFYQEEEYCRAITLGMLKFGLPDIYIEDLSCNSGIELASFINLTVQTLWEKQKIEDSGQLKLSINNIKNTSFRKMMLNSLMDNAEGEATITLVEGIADEGDPVNRLMEISFPEKNRQVEHNQLFTKLFGSEDEITSLRHNEELLEASARAKEKIPELFKLFSKGLSINRHLLIKFPFENDLGEREWMWVEIIKWNNNTIEGLLQNDPAIVKNLKAGQKVSKDINEMFDYIIYNEDGSYEGNKTGEIMMKMQH